MARVMRVIRNTVDATRRALDDPTGAYTDFVAAMESLGDDHLTTAEAFIASFSGASNEGVNLSQVAERIEILAPPLTNGGAKTAMVAIYALWHEWIDLEHQRPEAAVFRETNKACLEAPSAIAFTLGLLSNRPRPNWNADEWAELASSRRAARIKGKEAALSAAVDALLQLEAADQLEAAGRHEEAAGFASNAVEEFPGNEDLLAWEERLIAGDHDPSFNVHKFLFGKEPPQRGPRKIRPSNLTRRPLWSHHLID
jgi:hypothetical protein